MLVEYCEISFANLQCCLIYFTKYPYHSKIISIQNTCATYIYNTVLKTIFSCECICWIVHCTKSSASQNTPLTVTICICYFLYVSLFRAYVNIAQCNKQHVFGLWFNAGLSLVPAYVSLT